MSTTEQSPAGSDLVDSSQAWVVVASAFVALFTVFGVAYSFGEFFGPMEQEFGSTRSATAFFFSITTFAYFALGSVTGRIADRVGPRPVMIFGAFAMVIGLLLTAEVSSLRQGYLTYGLGVGLGVACCYVPIVATVGAWFQQKRTLALGLAVAGIGTGTLVLVPIIEQVIETQGWRQAYRVFALISAILLTIAAVGARRSPITSTAPGRLRDAIGGRPDFLILYASSVFSSACLFTAFVFLADYVDTTGTSGSAALLLGLIGMSSIVGRLGFGAIAAKVGTIGLYRWSCLGLGASYLIWVFADTSYTILVVFALVLGLAYGGIIALSPAVVAELFGTVGMGSVLGALYTANGVGGLLGPPLIGRIVDSSSYTTAQLTSVVLGLIGGSLLFLLHRGDP